MTDVIVRGSVRIEVHSVNFDVRPADLIYDRSVSDPHEILLGQFLPRAWEHDNDTSSEIGIVTLKSDMGLKELIQAWDHGSLLSLAAVLKHLPHLPNQSPLYAIGHSVLKKEGERRSTFVPKIVSDGFPRNKIKIHDTKNIFVAGSRFLVRPH